MVSGEQYYELAYLLSPTATEEEIAAKEQALKDVITSKNAVIDSASRPARKWLAYQIKGSNEAYFGAIRFTAFPSVIEELKAEIDKVPDISRLKISKTKKMELKTIRRIPTPSYTPKKEEAGASEAVIDKQLEEIL